MSSGNRAEHARRDMTLLSLYVHIPFCHRRCPYCSFYHERHSRDGEVSFVDAVVDEARRTLDSIPGGARLDTVYFGGGTPSVLAESSWSRILKIVDEYVSEAERTEFTCELNPEDVSEALLDYLSGAGINRISLGVQSMDEVAQKVLARCPPETNRRAARLVMDRFSNVSFDVLLGVPNRPIGSLESTLDELLASPPAHFSVYCLEPGGDVGEKVERFFDAVDAGRSAEEYLIVCDRLETAGYRHYEVSNFALPCKESRHNRVYWEYGDYVGLGPGAHSYLFGERFSNPPSLQSYVARTGGQLEEGRVYDNATPAQLEMERVMLGLRTDRGVNVKSLHCPDGEINAILEGGLGVVHEGRLRLTARGFLVLNEVVLRLFR
jgi:oxygen-independent coproporphyrinogen-3 oxidase